MKINSLKPITSPAKVAREFSFSFSNFANGRILPGVFTLMILIFQTGFSLTLKAQTPVAPVSTATVEWMSFDEAMKRMETEPRKVFIDVYTDWCGWCKRMDASTFSHPQIASYLNEKWYAVKFDAEQKAPVMYKGKEYTFVPSQSRGYNQLAAELTGGRLSYPTTVYLDEKADPIQSIPGYKDAYNMDKILQFFGENHYLNRSWVAFQEEYKSPLRQEGTN